MVFTAANTFYADGGVWYDFADETGTPPPAFPVNPGVVLNATRLAAIDETSAPYLAGYNKIISGSYASAESLPGVRSSQRYASLGYVPFDQGVRISGGAAEVPAGVAPDAYYKAARDDGVACAVQAYLWYITGTAQYRTNAIAILDAYKDVESFGPGGSLANTSYKPLANGLGMENMVQALSVLGDFPTRAEVITNFVTYWYDELWHPLGGNWLATFANAKLGIAVASADPVLLADALAFYDTVIKANIWLTSDGALVGELPRHPVTNAASAPSNYPAHWWSQVPASRSSSLLTNGQYCEFTRDDAHMMMGLGGLVNGMLTIEHQTGTGVSTYGARLIAAYELTAASLNTKLDSAITPSGWDGWRLGFLPALATFGAGTLPEVAELVARETAISVPGTENQHIMQGLLFPVGT